MYSNSKGKRSQYNFIKNRYGQHKSNQKPTAIKQQINNGINYHQKQNKEEPIISESHLTIRKLSSKRSQQKGSIKQQFDKLVHQVFVQLDFDFSGFITSSKIAYCKQMSQRLFYFFGGVFQKIKQLGAVTEKVFASLCEEAYIHSKKEDVLSVLQNEYCQNITSYNFADKSSSINIKERKSKSKYKKSQIKTQTSLKKLKNKLKQSSSKKIQNDLKPFSKFSLNLKLKDFQKTTKKQFLSQQKHKKSQFNQKQTGTSRNQFCQENISFDSSRVRQLTERVDRQLQQSTYRLYSNRYFR